MLPARWLSTDYRRDARVQVLRDAWMSAARDQIIDTAHSRHRCGAVDRAAADELDSEQRRGSTRTSIDNDLRARVDDASLTRYRRPTARH